ncbi:1-acyl-sn-glycerol-3-phosphate acyltransferase [Aeromonas schubertii]|uniref:1-acyl-sn-glycerol-3-phosphate acyltransferase n=1 Tax=Aeromonas schubertii TaxID=652 RepID=UPI0010A79186|nr:1-acyl-sn-glycerol-3-phosphate acyltransferase [Aeromonas schubertii]QCG49164.1 1-acyl-sn-glycerol-3-phosphate acyltransferase [Aeromonas schubertii]
MAEVDRFAEIRPYNDDEVAGAIERLVQDDEFIGAIARYRFGNLVGWLGWAIRPLIRLVLRRKWAGVNTVRQVQLGVTRYMERMIAGSTRGVTFSGLEHLEPGKGYLFISNHRDIAMDPAFVNWGLFKNGFDTVRIAIGDNLLRKPCATELMRLNKSFIVKRSAKGPREMMKTFGDLSAYIGESLASGHSIWIAQKEGRAKDGDDRTDPAILKMFYMDGKKQKIEFADYMRRLNIVPVSISYECDPTDMAKARELYEKAHTGRYEKGEFEDIESIVAGIVGQKGRVHVTFGAPLQEGFSDPDELAEVIDRVIWRNYRLFPNNYLAAGEADQVEQAERQAFEARLAQVPEAHRDIWRAMYARPVENLKKI